MIIVLKLIKEFQKEDERIILMRHNINKGTLMTRNDGAKIAKGEYLLFIDGDDLLVNNILEKSYLKAKEKNIDIIQFQTYSGDYFKSFYCSNKKRKTEPIYQPELSSLMYYEDNILHQSEFNIWGKLIKRDTFLEGIKSIDNYYIGQWKNGLRHGKGTEYYSNGKIKYEGDYINDKREGNGKYIWEDGEYYIGQFKNGLRHGKGTMYYSNGEIKSEGDWINDEFVDNNN